MGTQTPAWEPSSEHLVPLPLRKAAWAVQQWSSVSRSLSAFPLFLLLSVNKRRKKKEERRIREGKGKGAKEGKRKRQAGWEKEKENQESAFQKLVLQSFKTLVIQTQLEGARCGAPS